MSDKPFVYMFKDQTGCDARFVSESAYDSLKYRYDALLTAHHQTRIIPSVAALEKQLAEVRAELANLKNACAAEIDRITAAYNDRGKAMRETGDVVRSLYADSEAMKDAIISIYEKALKKITGSYIAKEALAEAATLKSQHKP